MELKSGGCVLKLYGQEHRLSIQDFPSNKRTVTLSGLHVDAYIVKSFITRIPNSLEEQSICTSFVPISSLRITTFKSGNLVKQHTKN